MNRPTPERRQQDDALQPFTESLRERVPSRESLLAEAKALSQKRRTARRATVSILLGAMCLGVVWQLDPAWRTEDVRAAIGQPRHLTLADGSQVQLDSGSHLRIEHRLRSRQLELVQGQAQFCVIHADKPFIVRSQSVRVRDVGTVFDVRSDRRGVEVGVIEGAVDVSNSDAPPQRLVAGQQLLANARTMGPPRPADLAALNAWRNGKLRFNGSPLSEVIIDLQRYRQAPISISDARVGTLRLSGEYDSNAVETLLELLPSILPVRVSKAADGSVVLSAVR